MKKFLIIGISFISLVICVFKIAYTKEVDKNRYSVYVDGVQVKDFDEYRPALYFSYRYADVSILDKSVDRWIYHNELKFKCVLKKSEKYFYEFRDAVEFAKNNGGYIIHIKTGNKVWDSSISDGKKIEINQIMQFPELPRGCSIVSLAMLLGHAGVLVDKMQLVSEVHHQDIPYRQKGDKIYFADPYYGFVGEISTFEEEGLGVYYPAVLELLERYLPDQSINLTGTNFDDLIPILDMGIPIWVMANAKYEMLEKDDFIVWITTDNEEIEITKWMHAVLVIGHDVDSVYLADPLGKRDKACRAGFIDAFNQMGKQAISYTLH